METPTLLPTLPIEIIERNQPQGNPQPLENFAEFLAKHGSSVTENSNLIEASEDKTNSSSGDPLLAALIMPLPLTLPDEKGKPSQESTEAQSQKSSTSPSFPTDPGKYLMSVQPFTPLPPGSEGDGDLPKGDHPFPEILLLGLQNSGKEEAGLQDSLPGKIPEVGNGVLHHPFLGELQKGNGVLKKGEATKEFREPASNSNASDSPLKTPIESSLLGKDKGMIPNHLKGENQGVTGAALKKEGATDISETLNHNQPGHDSPFKNLLEDESTFGKKVLNSTPAVDWKGVDKNILKQNDLASLSGNGFRNVGTYESLLYPGGSQKLTAEMPKEVKNGFSPSLIKTENLEISQQISQKVIWSLRNNEERIRLTLNPPELGNVYMEITRENESIKTTLWTDNQMAKITLEASQPQIQKIMESEGFKLEKFNVFVQQDMGSFHGRRENPVDQDFWMPSQFKEQKSEIPSPQNTTPIVEKGMNWELNYVDVFV